MKQRRYNGKKTKKRSVWLILLLIVFGISVVKYYRDTHFMSETFINGIDCSYLNVEDAKAKIEEESNSKISFIVLLPREGSKQLTKKYEASEEEIEAFEIKVADSARIKEVLEIQKENKNERIFEISQLFSVNENAVSTYLTSIPELEGDNMVMPQNAYLISGDNILIEVVAETYGNTINFNEACSYAIEALKEGKKSIDFTTMTKVEPDILATNKLLLENQKKVNAILSTIIEFKLGDGSTVSLDIGTMKSWIKYSEDGSIEIDVDTYLPEFVEFLASKVEEVNAYMEFSATDSDRVSLSVRKDLRASLDKEKQIAEIRELLGSAETHVIKPSYNITLFNNEQSTYVELDITRQTVWMYKNGECILEAPCVTGDVAQGYSTPTGIYFLTYKTTDAVLRGYNSDGSRYASPVDYWMPFNGGIGFHDASWRYGKFGGEIYKTNGSHGCVNMPRDAAEILYNNIDSSIPIIVYES